MKLRTLLIVPLLALLAGANASGNEILDDLAYSLWDSTYIADNGRPVGATIELRGDRGSYVTRTGSRGLLYALKYSVGAPAGPDGVPVISGYWQYENGQRGYFTFFVKDNGERFEGQWSHTKRGRRSAWDGTRLPDRRRIDAFLP